MTVPASVPPYWYFVPYDRDAHQALAALRRREFEAGRYYPVLARMYSGDPNLADIHPGARHESIADAVAAAGDSGTRSILDVDAIGARLAAGVAAPVPDHTLREVFELASPTRASVEERITELLEDLGPGQCVYLTVFEDGAPSELFFLGLPST